jgi:hypothetical protein
MADFDPHQHCRSSPAKVTSGDLKGLNFQRLPHPPFSPDVARSDFYLFGSIKGKIAWSEFGGAEQLVSEVVNIPNSISHMKLADVFGEWERWLPKGIDMEEDEFD